jgi:hypothetical protein
MKVVYYGVLGFFAVALLFNLNAKSSATTSIANGSKNVVRQMFPGGLNG